MCNKIHDPSNVQRINKTGIGYKIFSEKNKTCFTSDTYETTNSGLVKWNRGQQVGDGFCFFLKKPEAERAMKELDKLHFMQFSANHHIKKIAYGKGICKQEERSMALGKVFEIALCKSFRIIDKET